MLVSFSEDFYYLYIYMIFYMTTCYMVFFIALFNKQTKQSFMKCSFTFFSSEFKGVPYEPQALTIAYAGRLVTYAPQAQSMIELVACK